MQTKKIIKNPTSHAGLQLQAEVEEEDYVAAPSGALPGAALVTGFQSSTPLRRMVTDSSSSDLSAAAAPMASDEPHSVQENGPVDDAMAL